jgi:hypothetical protein
LLYHIIEFLSIRCDAILEEWKLIPRKNRTKEKKKVGWQYTRFLSIKFLGAMLHMPKGIENANLRTLRRPDLISVRPLAVGDSLRGPTAIAVDYY